MNNPIAREPNNEFTQMIHRLGTMRSGRVEGVVSATPTPSARSASIGPKEEAPLSEGEKAQLDAKLAALGYPQEAQAQPEPVTVAGTMPPLFMPGSYSVPTLPNFDKVQSIDLSGACVWIDGLAFPISEQDARNLRQYAIRTAAKAIEESLTSALNSLTPEATDAPDEAVQPLPDDEAGDGVLGEEEK